jgi:hypothetical protein
MLAIPMLAEWMEESLMLSQKIYGNITYVIKRFQPSLKFAFC